MKKKKAKTGKTSLKSVSKKMRLKKKRTRRANTKDIIKADKLAERLIKQSEHDIEEIRKTLVVDDYADLDNNEDGYHDESDLFEPYKDEMYD
jgi:hypothetical protein